MDLYQKYLVYISSGLQDWNTFNFVISFEPFLNVSFFFQGERGAPGMPGYTGEPGEKVRRCNIAEEISAGINWRSLKPCACIIGEYRSSGTKRTRRIQRNKGKDWIVRPKGKNKRSPWGLKTLKRDLKLWKGAFVDTIKSENGV